MARLTILHTSDMHNKLTPDLASRLRSLARASPGCLVLDSGDAIWAGNIFWRPGGEPILDLMNSVPYDAMCMGNREFHFLDVGASSKTSRAGFPVLSANLRRSRDRGGEERGAGLHVVSVPAEEDCGAAPFSRRARVCACAHFERDGLRITVLGLSVPCITQGMLARRVSSFYFDQPISAARELAPSLRDDCDVLIALTHLGVKQDRELAAAVPGIDLILGGHTHTITNEPELVNGTRILHHGFYAHYVGKVGVELEHGRLSVKDELVPLSKA